jgi:molybdenum cofactor cytidylyltransferase
MVLNLLPDGVLIAAGKSERMGSWKMMLPLGGSTVIDRSLDTMLGVCSRVVLVAGYRGEELKKHCAGRKRVQVVMNESYESGMFSSVQRGFKEITSGYFFFGLGDMPMVRAETYRELLRTARSREKDALPSDVLIPTYNKREGHPVLLSRAVVRKVAEEGRNGSSGTLRDVFEAFEIQYVPVNDPGIVEDLDTAKDYKAARLRNHGGTPGC